MKTLLAFLLATAVLSVANAATAVHFSDYRNYVIGSSPGALTVADVNKDGISDLVVAASGGAQVLLGKSDGTFAAPIAVEPFYALSVAVADFNKDGHLDLAITILTNGAQLVLAFGNGDGTFQTPKLLNVPCIDCYLAAGDFNKDGKMDLAVASTSTIAIYLGDGAGHFQFHPISSYPATFTSAIVAANLNSDGTTDLVVTDFGAKAITVLLGNGQGFFTPTSYAAAPAPFQAVLTDLNGDGLPDLASIESTTGSVLVRLNLGKGAFGSAQAYPGGWVAHRTANARHKASLPGISIKTETWTWPPPVRCSMVTETARSKHRPGIAQARSRLSWRAAISTATVTRIWR